MFLHLGGCDVQKGCVYLMFSYQRLDAINDGPESQQVSNVVEIWSVSMMFYK